MARGLFYASDERERDPGPKRQRIKKVDVFRSRTVDFCAIALLLIALLVPLHKLWAVQLILVLLLLSVPGFLVLRTLRIPMKVIADFPALVPCASISLLLFTGLALDLLGLLAGMASPLRTVPILCSIEVVCIVLLIVSKDAGPQYDIVWRVPRNATLLILSLAMPLVAAAGALRLNSGYSNKLAVIALLLCLAVLFATMLYASRLDTTILIVILFSVGLAMLLAFSLRGALVYGFDISTEYQRLNQTTVTGAWHVAHYNDAYGAMLSLTVMPTEIHFLTGVSDLMILKLVYPVIGALFPIEIFAFARRILSPMWAYTAAAITILQASFIQQLPALARQEAGLALFGALVAVMLYRPSHRAGQWALVVLLAFSMVVSHYSTTYVAITILGAAVVFQLVASCFRSTPRVTGTILLAFMASLVGALIWYGPVTRSTTELGALAQTVSSQGLDLLPTQSPGENPITAYLQTGTLTMSASKYQQQVHAEYVLGNSPITPLNDAGLARYDLHDSIVPVPLVRLGFMHSAVSLASLIGQQMINIMGAIGAFLLAFHRRSNFAARAIGFLGLGATIFLVVVRLSGTLADFYNASRALLQSLGVFSVAFCWILQRLDRGGRRMIGPVLLITAAFTTAFALNTTGLLNAILGGGVQSNLANSGEDYERFVRTPQEVAAASWLGTQVLPGQYVYADQYAQLPMDSMTDLGNHMIEDVTPLTIDQNAWVYASSTNVVDGRSRVEFGNYLVTYAFPSGFLNQNFNVVYSDGASEVFHR
jgi:uncharacterized membrane protein